MKPSASAGAAPPALEFLPDWRELAIGVFIVYVCLSGDDRALPLLGSAADIVTATMLFEFMICLPAVFSSGVIKEPSLRKRAASCLGGTALYLAVTVLQLLKFGLPWLIPQCLWMLYARLRPPTTVPWFSPAHCRMITNVCMTAWICALLAISLLFGLGGLVGVVQADTGSTVLPPWGYAVVWGVFYAVTSIAAPMARARALAPSRARESSDEEAHVTRRRPKRRRRP